MSKLVDIVVPDIGDFNDVPVIEVLVGVGDSVAAEQSLVTLESDKATMEVPSPAAGVIRELRVSLEDNVSAGDVVAVLEPTAPAASAEAAQTGSNESQSNQEDSSQEDAGPEGAGIAVAGQARNDSTHAPGATLAPGGQRQSPPVPMGGELTLPGKVPYASPAIRRFARELGADLMRVSGSGKGGRILRDDVNAFVKSVMSGAAQAGTGGLGFDLPPAPKVNFNRFGKTELKPLSRIQKISGAYLHRNWVSIPHVTQHDLADITEMEAWRKRNAEQARKQGFKLTPLVFLIKASVAALQNFPIFNASLDAARENLVLKKYFHIGIAVDTPEGLVVPVLRNCEDKDIFELAAELSELSKKARAGKLKPADIQGGCFSISSLGGIGGTAFTPIINAPEVAVLGVSRSRVRPQWDGESFLPRLMLPLSLSYDHRVIDGANAARFTRYLADCLEDFQALQH